MSLDKWHGGLVVEGQPLKTSLRLVPVTAAVAPTLPLADAHTDAPPTEAAMMEVQTAAHKARMAAHKARMAAHEASGYKASTKSFSALETELEKEHQLWCNEHEGRSAHTYGSREATEMVRMALDVPPLPSQLADPAVRIDPRRDPKWIDMSRSFRPRIQQMASSQRTQHMSKSQDALALHGSPARDPLTNFVDPLGGIAARHPLAPTGGAFRPHSLSFCGQREGNPPPQYTLAANLSCDWRGLAECSSSAAWLEFGSRSQSASTSARLQPEHFLGGGVMSGYLGPPGHTRTPTLRGSISLPEIAVSPLKIADPTAT